MIELVSDDRDEGRRPRREAFIHALYAVMEQRGVTQRELRDQFGWGSHTTMNRWRRLIAEPTPDQVFELEDYLKLKAGTLSSHLGYVKAVPGKNVPKGIEAAIDADEVIPDWAKQILHTAYREIMRSLEPDRLD